MLKHRIITAIVLLLVLLGCLGASSAQFPFPFLALMALMVGCAVWEWLRMNGLSERWSVLGGVAVGGFLLGYAWQFHLTPDLLAAVLSQSHGVWVVMALLWLLLGVAGLYLGPNRWLNAPKALRLTSGVLLLMALWLALALSFGRGLNFLFSIFVLVWVADTGAYFGGRAFGKNKLAITISPGKSWEGVWTGAAFVTVLALVWVGMDAWLLPSTDAANVTNATNSINAHHGASLYTVLYRAWGWLGLLPCVWLITATSVVGDLLESLVKRAVGVKDSSGLLPGHGGVLDRIDALLPVFPVALALGSLAML